MSYIIHVFYEYLTYKTSAEVLAINIYCILQLLAPKALGKFKTKTNNNLIIQYTCHKKVTKGRVNEAGKERKIK